MTKGQWFTTILAALLIFPGGGLLAVALLANNGAMALTGLIGIAAGFLLERD